MIKDLTSEQKANLYYRLATLEEFIEPTKIRITNKKSFFNIIKQKIGIGLFEPDILEKSFYINRNEKNQHLFDELIKIEKNQILEQLGENND
jgi:hypothetical protein